MVVPRPEEAVYEFSLSKVKQILRRIYEASIESVGGWGKVIELYREYVERARGVTSFDDWLIVVNDVLKKIQPMYKPPTPVCIAGPPGIGKSFVIAEFARELYNEIRNKLPPDLARDFSFSTSIVDAWKPNYFTFFDIRASQMEPPDILGIPYYDTVTGTTKYYPPRWLPRNFFAILFFDELNLSPEIVLHALMQLFLDRRISASGYVLPPFVMLVAAMNRPVDVRGVPSLPAPLANRMAHVIIEVKTPEGTIRREFLEEWLTWARKNIHPFVVLFVMRYPEMLYTYDPARYEEPTGYYWAFSTPRTLDFLSRVLEQYIPSSKARALLEAPIEGKPLYEYLREKVIEAVRKGQEATIKDIIEKLKEFVSTKATELDIKLPSEETIEEIKLIAKSIIGFIPAEKFASFLRDWIGYVAVTGATVFEEPKTLTKLTPEELERIIKEVAEERRRRLPGAGTPGVTTHVVTPGLIITFFEKVLQPIIGEASYRIKPQVTPTTSAEKQFIEVLEKTADMCSYIYFVWTVPGILPEELLRKRREYIGELAYGLHKDIVEKRTYERFGVPRTVELTVNHFWFRLRNPLRPENVDDQIRIRTDTLTEVLLRIGVPIKPVATHIEKIY